MTALMNTLADFFTGSPAGRAIAQQAVASAAEKTLEERKAWAAELAMLDAQELTEIRDVYQPARAIALAEVERRQKSLDVAREQLHTIERSRSMAAHDTDRQRGRLRGALRDSASPLLAAFVSELRGTLPTTCQQLRSISRVGIDGRTYCLWSNEVSVETRVAAIHKAIAECGENGSLLYTPLDDSALATALDRLLAGIPALEPIPQKVIDQGFAG